MRAIDIIRKKRDGLSLTSEEIHAFVDAATHGTWPEYQLAALLMAIWIRGMNDEETATLTGAMVHSGEVLDLSDIPGPKCDKHSTGGVGDSTSLVLAPLAAACGVVVPMMSGRGLGHTGGTLDKLEAIPGFRVGLSIDELKQSLREIGVAMIGQTSEIAPADRKLYELRDVTSTVESIPLISASIMSKKLAEGIGSLVLDVKFGHGAFMKRYDDARRLARTMVGIGTAHGVRTIALMSCMDHPLGVAVGNSVETIECIEALKGRGPADLESLSIELAARMVMLSEVSPTLDDARERATRALRSGHGVEKFREIVARQGGDPWCIDDYSRMPLAKKRIVVSADRSGFLQSMAAETIGRAAMRLGAGRDKKEDQVDPGVGILLKAVVGAELRHGDALAEIIGRTDDRMREAAEMVQSACTIGDDRPKTEPLIRETIEY